MNNNIRILLKSGAWLLVGFLIMFIGISRPKALTTTTSYADFNLSLSNANKYIYGTFSGGVQTNATGTIGTNYTGRATGMIFYTQISSSLNYTYKIRVNFYGDDLSPDFYSGNVKVQTCDTSWTCGDVTLVSVAKQNNNGYSTWVDIEYRPIQVGSRTIITLSANGQYLTGTQYFGVNSIQYEYYNANQDIIDNQTQNTNDIINNNNNNTQAIIDANKQNFESCSDKFNATIEQGSLLGVNGEPNLSDSRTRTANYINVEKNTTYTLSMASNLQSFVFYYDNSNNFIERVPANWTNNYVFTTTDNVAKIKIIFSKVNGGTITPSETTDIHLYACINRLDEQTNSINDMNDTIKDDDIGDSTQDAADFITDFDTNTFGLTSIVTAPLNLIQSLTSSTCNDLELPLPYLDNKKLTLPCMSTIYSQHFGAFFTIYQTITYGIIAYWVIVRIFNQVKDFKNPEHDEIEVVDL